MMKQIFHKFLKKSVDVKRNLESQLRGYINLRNRVQVDISANLKISISDASGHHGYYKFRGIKTRWLKSAVKYHFLYLPVCLTF